VVGTDSEEEERDDQDFGVPDEDRDLLREETEVVLDGVFWGRKIWVGGELIKIDGIP
jgi:hypothetical protein